MIWTDKPLCALDTETTGTDPETARIITVCLGYSGMRGQFGADNWLLPRPLHPRFASRQTHRLRGATSDDELRDMIAAVRKADSARADQ